MPVQVYLMHTEIDVKSVKTLVFCNACYWNFAVNAVMLMARLQKNVFKPGKQKNVLAKKVWTYNLLKVYFDFLACIGN
jgi:hypothetical protein